MRRLLKFLHTMGAIGMMGAMASLLILLIFSPPASSPAFLSHRVAMGAVATWLLFPSIALTLVAGLLALGFNRAFHNAGWAWAKLATGVLMFEGTLVYIVGPIQEQGRLAAGMLAGEVATASLDDVDGPMRNSIWVLLAVATANVVLGVWRPRFVRTPESPAQP